MSHSIKGDIEALKTLQRDHSEDHFQPHVQTFSGGEAHDYFRRIPFLKTKELLNSAGVTFSGKSILIASCGTGIDVFYLRQFYDAKYFVSDLSENAVKTALMSLPNVEGRVEDSEKLSFADNSFDYGFMAGSLHHLPRPFVGLYELLRVSKYGIVVIEPNDTWLTRLATRFGLATEVEPAGNYVFRFSAHDIERISKSLFIPFRTSRFFSTHRVAKNSLEFSLLKFANGSANLIAPGLGNYMVAFIQKSGDSHSQ